jgi:hypothetical protein
MADVETEAAVQLAVQLGALGQCDVCGATWNVGEIELEDEETFATFVRKARAVAESDPELDLFEDEDALRAALARVVEDASPEQDCAH